MPPKSVYCCKPGKNLKVIEVRRGVDYMASHNRCYLKSVLKQGAGGHRNLDGVSIIWPKIDVLLQAGSEARIRGSKRLEGCDIYAPKSMYCFKPALKQ